MEIDRLLYLTVDQKLTLHCGSFCMPTVSERAGPWHPPRCELGIVDSVPYYDHKVDMAHEQEKLMLSVAQGSIGSTISVLGWDNRFSSIANKAHEQEKSVPPVTQS